MACSCGGSILLTWYDDIPSPPTPLSRFAPLDLVQMQAMKEEPAADYKCKDKFLVQSIAITAEREQMPHNELWPTMEREAKDQILEKKIRCVFLPPVERAVPQATDGDYVPNAVEFVEEDVPESPASPQAARSIPESELSTSTSTPTGEEVQTLKRELDAAQATIRNLRETLERLQSEANVLRQRKPESSSPSAPTYSAVQVQSEAMYPLSYVAGAAATSFIFAYLFF